MNKNSLRHVPPGKMADLEDDLETQAEMKYIAARKIEAANDHHQLHRAEGRHR
jgi:hypothetical protein